MQAEIRFEQEGANLTAVEIVRSRRNPVIGSLHRTLLALGIVIASYQARPGSTQLIERVVLQRRDGGAIDAQLSADTKAAILPLVLESDGDAA